MYSLRLPVHPCQEANSSMKRSMILILIILLCALICMGLCIFTDLNDGLFLPLGLGLCVLGNLLNILYRRKDERIS